MKMTAILGRLQIRFKDQGDDTAGREILDSTDKGSFDSLNLPKYWLAPDDGKMLTIGHKFFIENKEVIVDNLWLTVYNDNKKEYPNRGLKIYGKGENHPYNLMLIVEVTAI
jgi:hypothetical protein